MPQQPQAGTAPQAPPTPATPSVPEAPAPTALPRDFAPPRNRAEYGALESIRSSLSDQLISASGRRDQIASELAEAAPAARAGLQQRLEVLDARIVQLEQDIAYTGRLITSPEAGEAMTTVPGSSPFEMLDSDQITGITIVFTIFVLFPLAIAISRFLWKRATAPRAIKDTSDSDRLERVEHAVETIAIEVERISEGQRFVTKLLAQPNGVPLAAAQRQSESASGSTERR